MVRTTTLVVALLISLVLPTLADAASTRWVNIRSGPGTHHPVVMVASPGTPLTVRTCGKLWCKVVTNAGVKGWISTEDISRK